MRLIPPLVRSGHLRPLSPGQLQNVVGSEESSPEGQGDEDTDAVSRWCKRFGAVANGCIVVWTIAGRPQL